MLARLQCNWGTTVKTVLPVRSVACHGKGRRALAELFSIEQEEETGARIPVEPFKVTPANPVPAHIPKPSWYHGKPAPDRLPAEIHDAQGIEKMRAAGRLAAEVLDMAGKMVAPGVTTDEIDRAVHDMTIKAGAYPSPLNYGRPPFPKSVCTSVNEVVCHGIPDMRPLRDGDIINVDVTVWLDGYHGDTSRTFFVGTPSNTAKQLVKATKEALEAGISVCKPGAEFREIGKAIQSYVNGTNFKVNKDFVGHGIGQNFHPMPYIFHFRNNERQGKMKAGQTFTIEPILHEGRNINCNYWSDDWTAVSRDGKWSAQFEHTILVTDDGHEILTEYEHL